MMDRRIDAARGLSAALLRVLNPVGDTTRSQRVGLNMPNMLDDEHLIPAEDAARREIRTAFADVRLMFRLNSTVGEKAQLASIATHIALERAKAVRRALDAFRASSEDQRKAANDELDEADEALDDAYDNAVTALIAFETAALMHVEGVEVINLVSEWDPPSEAMPDDRNLKRPPPASAT